MKKLILTATAIALIPFTAHAQLLGGGGLGGGLGGSLGGTLNSTAGSTLERTTSTIRGTVDGTGSTDGNQSVNSREGRVSADRSANGSIAGSTASLADLAVPNLGGMANGQANGQASGQGSANAQLIGTDAVTGTIAPAANQMQSVAGRAVGQATGTASGVTNNAPMPGLPAFGSANASGQGSAAGNGTATLMSTPLAVAGSAASSGQGVASVAPGMPVMTPQGASLGKVREIVADGRGQVQQVVVSQGNVTRTLPAGMFSANGNALIAGQTSGEAASQPDAERTQPAGEETN